METENGFESDPKDVAFAEWLEKQDVGEPLEWRAVWDAAWDAAKKDSWANSMANK